MKQKLPKSGKKPGDGEVLESGVDSQVKKSSLTGDSSQNRVDSKTDKGSQSVEESESVKRTFIEEGAQSIIKSNKSRNSEEGSVPGNSNYLHLSDASSFNNNLTISPSKVLLITTLASFMTAFDGSGFNIALPIIGKEFHASALILSWISTMYLLITATLLIPAGKLADTYGRTKFFKAGVLIFSISSFIGGFANSEVLLLVSRGLQGIGASAIFTTGLAILVLVYPPNQRGKVIGINTAAVYTGLSSGPFIGGIITDLLGWEYIFFITAIIGVFIFIFSSINLKIEWKEELTGKFDLIGSLILVMTIVFIMVGISFLPNIIGFVSIVLGIISAIVFYYYEQRIKNPLLNIALFKENRTFTLSSGSALINYSATFAISFLMSFYLQSIKMLSPKEAGMILITQPIIQAIFSPIAGRLSDIFEPRIVSSTGMVIITVGLIVFVFLSPGLSFVIIVSNLAMLGLGFALFSSPNANAIMSSVEKKFYGIASSTLALVRLIGQMMSMGIVIVIFTVYIGGRQITIENQHEFLQSTQVAFILFSVLCLIGVYASLSRGKIHK
ncbi:MAG: MFS transporter [Melioribacteraceae bacterium]